jgi:Tol biopolymer transport system component
LLQVAQNISSFSRNITWSPSGNLIAFIGEGVSFKPETVRAINFAFTDGRGTYQLPNSPNFLLSVDWSPDGSRFVYATDREIFSMNIDGTGRRQLTTAIQNPNFSTTDSDPRWSPDGARILFTRLSNGLSDLYVMNADGTGLSRLLNINGTTDGSWSPDGTKVVYAQQNEIYTSDNVGATQRLTNNIYYEFTPDWQPVVVANPTPTPSPTPTFSISYRQSKHNHSD